MGGATPPARVSIMGVDIANLSRAEVIHLIEGIIRSGSRAAHAVFIVNAHTLNLAATDDAYRRILNGAYRVLADGTGARWAARLRGVRLKDNLVGTDLVPALFRETSERGYRYFLLGADPATIARAAPVCARLYPGWEQVGFHHGYAQEAETAALIDRINGLGPDLLLVGMGNPLQEAWIHRHLGALNVPVCLGVGGLFHFWAGDLQRAPGWVRRHGFEWVQILLQQPHKWRRYILGNPLFLWRMARSWPRERVRRA